MDAAQRFGALSQPTRLDVLKRLVAAGQDGLPAGQLSERVEVPASTLSFHLKELSIAGLVTSERRGRVIQYFADFSAVRGMIRYLMEDCCQNNPSICLPFVTGKVYDKC